MESLIIILLLAVAVYWLYQFLFGRKLSQNQQPVYSTHVQPEEKNSSLTKTDQYGDHLRPGRHPEDFLRERDSHDRHVKRLATYIRNNMTEPDSGGFVGYQGLWRNDFIVRTPDGKTYRGRVKLDEVNYMITIKAPGFGGRKPALDLREVEIE